MSKMMLMMAALVPLLGCDGQGDTTPAFDKVEVERLLPPTAAADLRFLRVSPACAHTGTSEPHLPFRPAHFSRYGWRFS
jgi:hypothetical protein